MDTDRFALVVAERLRRPRRNERASRSDRLTDALRDLVSSGDLLPGSRLPGERALATALGMSRGTVVAALEALAAEGLVERRHGSGTYVTGTVAPTPTPTPTTAPTPAPGPEGRFARWLRPGTVVVDLAKSVVPDPGLLPDLGLTVDDLLDVHPTDGYNHPGDADLRTALARPPFTADDVVVTSGGQQGLHLVADALVRPGDHVLVERVTYPGMLAAVERFGGIAVPVDGDRHGMDPAALRAALRTHTPRFVFLMPVHNPTGLPAPAARVRELARAVREEGRGALVVEDHTLAALILGGARPPASAVAWAPELTVCVGSLSKTLWGGLRIGWITAPAPVLALLADAKRRTDLAASALGQRFAVHLLADPAHDVRLERWQAALTDGRDHLTALLRERLPRWRFSVPAGGMSLWVRLPGGDGEEFADVARRHGVAVAPGAVFCPTGSAQDGRDRVRVSFAWPAPVLDKGVDLLTAAWAAYRRSI